MSRKSGCYWNGRFRFDLWSGQTNNELVFTASFLDVQPILQSTKHFNRFNWFYLSADGAKYKWKVYLFSHRGSQDFLLRRGGANHKSHAMMPPEIFKKGNFLWDKDIVKLKIRSRGLALGLNQDLAKGRGLKPKVKLQKCLKRETRQINLCNSNVS